MLALNENIRRLRRAAGLSQEELAGRLGVSRQSVSLWEQGETNPTVENIYAMTEVLGVSFDELMAQPTDPKPTPEGETVTAIIAFGINSGAYVAENIRAGILSVDIGQTEAGRALGLTGGITMRKIIIPQAIKNVIPTIGNEMIALIKETSIVSMIGMYDLTMAAKIIGSGNNMASYLIPMSVVALFYLAIVYLLTFAIKLIERRLRAGDKR